MTTPAIRADSLHESGGPVRDHEDMRAKVRRLEAELERYRAHAERTSRLFLAVTDYAAWVREQARHDAELALRKARARAEKLMATARELERTERELARLQTELERLEALTDETRTRLSTFLTTGLEMLNAEVEAGPNDPGSGQDDLQETLHKQLSGASEQAPARVSERRDPGGLAAAERPLRCHELQLRSTTPRRSHGCAAARLDRGLSRSLTMARGVPTEAQRARGPGSRTAGLTREELTLQPNAPSAPSSTLVEQQVTGDAAEPQLDRLRLDNASESAPIREAQRQAHELLEEAALEAKRVVVTTGRSTSPGSASDRRASSFGAQSV